MALRQGCRRGDGHACRKKAVECETIEKDHYGRWIGTCYADGVDVGQELVRTGYAWAFLRFSDVYEADQTAAMEAGRGIWQAETQTPWDFRSGRWDRAVAEVPEEAPEGCPIKGNISQNGKIYHPPWSPWYGRTKINEAKGERWFCDEGEAVKAGWRAPYLW
ncbi:thermonuclease family protein [Tropicimonas sp. TH_r6]|uniref:thermonuclease family protein n=1 Tax=Tropicimonas sp. TH_r6 TaxID=3082085 RepID=UPI002955C53A|nr:thermonuclease family protein [Tropicimonas sp. TH_r6]MDV7145910.1 thermonuclease family protein [Tropicimonas sp. TH_r6]